ncbi:hypothetical protein PIROE2DRAFT_1774 [Piromyces sp. E2]|nr:hypothetical protein PIROE2DRAFT_1774 [Piromyces sp. E2]|eukprot:OUM70096.1 hypothetical protein PIROE2DRAFT_1774 [Piromyces sp. E2]
MLVQLRKKECYLSTDSFGDFVEVINGTNGYSKLSVEYDELTPLQLFNEANPVIPFELPACKWKPTLLVGVFKSLINNGTITQFDSSPVVLFNSEFSIDDTFRNIKASRVKFPGSITIKNNGIETIDVSQMKSLTINTDVTSSSTKLDVIILDNIPPEAEANQELKVYDIDTLNIESDEFIRPNYPHTTMNLIKINNNFLNKVQDRKYE